MTDLLALADRVEKLTGPDRKTDADIFQAIDGKLWKQAYNDATMPCGCPHEMAVAEARRRSPAYSASLDAAMTLVPEGWIWQISNRAPAPDEGRAYIHNGHLIFAGIGGSRPNPKHQSVEVVTRTAVIALVAACLRARASTDKGEA